MRYRLLDLLVCPKCGGTLRCEEFSSTKNKFKAKKKGIVCKHFCGLKQQKVSKKLKVDCNKCYSNEIKDGLLKCKCGSWFPVINYVARVLPDSLKNEFLVKTHDDFLKKHSKKLPELNISKERSNRIRKIKKTMEHFGFEHLTFEERIDQDHEEQFLKWMEPLMGRKDFNGRLTMDAGCGAGRQLYYSASYGAEMVGMDLSEGITTAYQKNKTNPDAHFVQADIYNLPLRPEFDLIYSVGVLHHTPDPKESFTNLTRYLKKNGKIFIWVYGREGNAFMVYVMNPLKKVLTRLPLPVLYGLSFFAAIPFYIVTNIIYRPLNKVKPLKSLMKRMPYNDYFLHVAEFTFRYKRNLCFDHMMSPVDHYHTGKEINEWYGDAKLKNIKVSDYEKNSWRGIGTK